MEISMEEYILFAQKNPLLVIGFIVVLGLIIWTEFNRITRKYKSLNANESVLLLNNDNTICIDVREDNEVKQGVIKDSRHIPLQSFSDKLSDYKNDKDKPFLIYCRSGSRSAHACGIMTKQGFTDVSNLAGGIIAWESANLPLTKKN